MQTVVGDCRGCDKKQILLTIDRDGVGWCAACAPAKGNFPDAVKEDMEDGDKKDTIFG